MMDKTRGATPMLTKERKRRDIVNKVEKKDNWWCNKMEKLLKQRQLEVEADNTKARNIVNELIIGYATRWRNCLFNSCCSRLQQ